MTKRFNRGVPRVLSDLLVGGSRSGERIAVDDRLHRLMVAPKAKLAFYWPGEPVEPIPDVEIYERRTWIGGYDFAPVDYWIIHGMSDETAMVTMQEHTAITSLRDEDMPI